MKRLLEYIFESNIEELKQQIIDKIKNYQESDNKDLLYIINKKLNIKKSDFDKWTKEIGDYLSNRGLKKNANDIIQKIKHYNCLDICYNAFNKINNDNSLVFTSDKILSNEEKEPEIFNLINKYVYSVNPNINDSDYDKKEFKSLLDDLANYTPKGSKTTIGKMEILCSMFLQDLNSNNNASDGFPTCDINCNKNRLEFKISGGRITGNTDQSKPRSPEILTEIFYKYINEIPDNNEEINEKINKFEGKNHLFEKIDNIKQIKKLVDENLIKPNIINEIIIKTFLCQLPNLTNKINNEYNINKDLVDKLIKKYEIINNKEISIDKLKELFLILHLANYQLSEKWTHLILFENNHSLITGKYKIINAPNSDSPIDIIKSFIDQIHDLDITCNTLPRYGGGSNIQNWAPTIIYNNK